MSSDNAEASSSIAGALTFPRSEQNGQPLPEQPRQPRNLQGLLRFAMEATKAEDAPGNSELGPMDEERRTFLEDALKNLTVDVAKLLHDAIKILTNTEKIHSIQLGETLPEDVDVSFSNILEFVDDIDIANDFCKMGGFAIFPVCYGSENDEVRALASTVLAELCQNNPLCQARALECGLLNVLLNLVNTEKGEALTKCLYALSCACREFDPACRELLAQDGCASVAQLLRDAEPAARTKAAFLIRYLANTYNEAKQQFIAHNLVKTIAEQIKTGHDSTSEHLLSILLSFVENLDPTVMAQCRDPVTDLKKILEDHLKHPELVGDQYREEKEYCLEILERVFEDCPQVETVSNEADR